VPVFTSVQEDDGVVMTDFFLPDVVDETCHGLTHVNRINDNPFFLFALKRIENKSGNHGPEA
jgi:hypothetical protein